VDERVEEVLHVSGREYHPSTEFPAPAALRESRAGRRLLAVESRRPLQYLRVPAARDSAREARTPRPGPWKRNGLSPHAPRGG